MSCADEPQASDDALISVVPLRITRGTARTYRIYVGDTTVDDTTFKETEVRADLTGATILFTVYDPDSDLVVLQKTSTNPAQIAILSQVVAATKGAADIKFVSTDLELLAAGQCYRYEIWLTMADGRQEQIVALSPFVVDERRTDPLPT